MVSFYNITSTWSISVAVIKSLVKCSLTIYELWITFQVVHIVVGKSIGFHNMLLLWMPSQYCITVRDDSMALNAKLCAETTLSCNYLRLNVNFKDNAYFKVFRAITTAQTRLSAVKGRKSIFLILPSSSRSKNMFPLPHTELYTFNPKIHNLVLSGPE